MFSLLPARISRLPSIRRVFSLQSFSKMSAPSPAQQWDSRYNTEVFQYGTEPNDFLKAHLARLANATSILCLAEGEGRNALAVLKATKENAKVTCIDLSKVGLEKAEKLFAQNGVAASRYETVVADLAEYDIGTNKWDAIVSIWCHVPEGMRKGLHARVVKGLKEKGGLLILEAYTPKQ